MKKLTLSVICALLLSNTAMAEEADPMTFFKDDSGKWTVSGYPDGNSFVSAQLGKISEERTKRLDEISSSSKSSEEKSILKAQVNQEFDLTEKRWRDYGEEADIVLSLVKGGTDLASAEIDAMNQMDKKRREEAKTSSPAANYDPEDETTSYNYGSVTDTIVADGGASSSSPTMNNNMFKQFNDLDCTYEEVASYMDKTKDKKTKAFSTAPSYSNTFKKTATKSAESLKGEEADCQTIFHDIKFNELPELSIGDLSAGLPSFDDFGNMLDGLGNKAGEQLGSLASDLYSVLREGFCERLSSEYVGDLAGDLVEDEYKDITKDSVFEGTKLNKLDKESGQNNFTYKVIKNQSGVSNSNLIKAIDVTRDDQSKYQNKYFDKELDSVLDDLEDDIFG